MHTLKIVIVLLFTALSLDASAQKKKPIVSHTGKSATSRERHNATKVKGSKAKIVCPIFDNSKYPYHGIGLKLGDPLAVTYKYYPNKKFAIAVDFGKTASGLYNRYYRDQLNESQNYDTLSEGASINYLSHRVKADFIGEVKLLYQIDAKNISPGLQVYVGAGWEWKKTKIQYDYLYSMDNTNSEVIPGTFTGNRRTQGPQAVVGIEYSYFKLPISAFIELEYFADVQADPGWRTVEGGVGLRYIF
jgi:hypothetical protein